MVESRQLETENVGFALSGEGRERFTKSPSQQERQMWACPSPPPVCDKLMHLVKAKGAREETQPAPSGVRTFFLCFFCFIFEVISPFLSHFYFASLLFHPPQISWLML